MAHMDDERVELTITTVAELITKLNEAFGNQDPINTACRELQALKQGKESLSPTKPSSPASLQNPN
ncbi:hypothetical protein Q9L58_010332 [Maublancomyces gigas]|uniref:Uncharacterized protein n=1 Tax=Discina gigas TaxID=1032678 RepID=A0ABR3G4G6_9PEZI